MHNCVSHLLTGSFGGIVKPAAHRLRMFSIHHLMRMRMQILILMQSKSDRKPELISINDDDDDDDDDDKRVNRKKL